MSVSIPIVGHEIMFLCKSTFNRSRSLAIATGFLSLLLSSCGDDVQRGDPRLDVYAVHGSLFVNGKPAKDAAVYLHPTVPHQNPNSKTPISSAGRVDADGGFKIRTYEEGDGAPAGDYKISITWNYPALGVVSGNFEGPDRLGGAFADPETTELTISVTAESENIIPKIELKADIIAQPKSQTGRIKFGRGREGQAPR